MEEPVVRMREGVLLVVEWEMVLAAVLVVVMYSDACAWYRV